jgi:hypothetical protein
MEICIINGKLHNSIFHYLRKGQYLLELCRYVVLNPVRAGIVKRPKGWRWSSYAATAGTKKSSPFLTVDWIRGQFGSDKKIAERQYREFVEA